MDEIEMMKMKRRKEERKKNIKLGLLLGVIGISVAICLIFTVFKPKPQKELVKSKFVCKFIFQLY